MKSVVATALLCCLTSARGLAADAPLQAGVATVDITPAPGLRMWGYSNRTTPATGALDPLKARALVLKSGEQSVAIVTLDLGRPPEDAVLAQVRDTTLAKCGVGNLLVTASHTHAAPNMESTADTPNPYAEQVGRQIAEIVVRAAHSLVPVKLGISGGDADFAHNRRKFLPDGRVAMQWRNAEREPTEPVDKHFTVVRVDRLDGTPLAALLHYACHPVVLGPDNLQYSADFVGGACARVESELKTTCLYLQGACGNINPYLDKTPLNQGGVAAMQQMGREFGNLATKAVASTETKLSEHPSVQFEARQVPVRLRWDLNDPEVRAVLSKAYGPRWDNYLAKTIRNNQIVCTLTSVLLEGQLALCGMPGEIFVQFQGVLRAESPVATTLLVGYANGYHAYFPTLRDAAAGGYGGKTATYVEPGSGERLTTEALITLYKMTGKLHEVPRAEDFQLLEYDEVRKAAR